MGTLNKFGVPLGPGGLEGRFGILQPKLKYRYRVRTVGLGPPGQRVQVNLTQQVMNVSKPQLAIEEVQLDSYISRAWVAGKHTWQPLSLVVRDDIANAVTSLIGYQLQKQHNHFEQTSPAAGDNYKFTTFIEVMDGGNIVVQEQWILEGCWLIDTNYDTLDYSASEVQIVTMSIRFDNATQSGDLFKVGPDFNNPGSILQGS